MTQIWGLLLFFQGVCLSGRVLPLDALTLNFGKKTCSKSTGKVTNIPLTMTEGAGTGWQWIPTASTGAVRKIWGKRKRRKKKKACRLRQGQDFSSVNKMNVKTRSQMRFHIRISQIPLLVTVWPPAYTQPSDFFFNLYIWNLIFYLWVR